MKGGGVSGRRSEWEKEFRTCDMMEGVDEMA